MTQEYLDSLTTEKLEVELDNLLILLLKYNKAYRNGESLINDSEFDLLEDVYRIYRPTDEYFDKIGYEISENDSRKRKLPIPMASMTKLHTIFELNKWVANKNIKHDTLLIMTPKEDGSSITRNEQTLESYTRGDGEYGRLSTEHINLVEFENPNKILKPIYTFGECIISKKRFNNYKQQIINEGVDIPPSNPRNTIAGLINNDVPNNNLKLASYIRYGVVTKDGTELSKIDQLEICNELNAVKIPYKKVYIKDLTEEYLFDLYVEWSKYFEIDGLIIDINDSELRQEIGRETGTNNPGYARAYKGSFETRKETTLISHKTNISKNGTLTIVGQIDPLELDGVMVSNVTLVNAKMVIDYGLFPGEKITIIRSGGVIPKVVKVNGHDIPFGFQFETLEEFLQAKQELIKLRKSELLNTKQLITHCPFCNSGLDWDENNVNLVCNNSDCETKNFYKVLSFFKTLEVDNLGEPTIQLFFDNGYNTVKKILGLDINTLKTLDRIGDTKATYICNNIHSKLKNVKLEKLQHASNLFGRLGSKKLLLINNYLFDNKIINPTIDQLILVEGISEKLATEYLNNINKFELFVENIKQYVSIQSSKTAPNSKVVNSTLSNINAVFTGIRDKELEEFIIQHGGIVSDGLSKNTTHLIMKQIGSGSSKEVKAQGMKTSHNKPIQIMEINEFKKDVNYL